MKLYREKMKKLRSTLCLIKLSVCKIAALLVATGTGLLSCNNLCYADETNNQEPTYEDDREEMKSLSVKVSRTDGLETIIAEGTVYYTNSDLNFTICDELNGGESLEYIVFCDNEDESAYVPLDGINYFYDISGVAQGVNYKIRFRSVTENHIEEISAEKNMEDASAENHIEEISAEKNMEYESAEENIKVISSERNMEELYDADSYVSEVKHVNSTTIRKSEVFSICADNTPPMITLENDFLLDEWYRNDIDIGMEILDVSGISSFAVRAAGFDKISRIYYGNEALGYIYQNINLFEQTSDENGQLLEIIACDRAGNKAVYQKKYYIDKVCPKLELIHEDETVYKKGVSVEAIFSDNISKNAVVYYSVKKTTDDICEDVENSSMSYSSSCGKISRDYYEDGSYHIEAYAEDAALNKTELKVFDFVIDTISPAIEIKGVSDRGKYNSKKSCALIINEKNYEDMKVTVVGNIDNLKTPKRIIYDDYYQNEERGIKTYSFSDNGRYELSITAADAAGNRSCEVINFTIDDTMPQINVENDINEKVFNRFPVVKFTIFENLYDTALISTELYKKDEYVLTKVPTDKNVLTSENTVITLPVKEEGNYILRISAVDESNNKSVKEIKFTVDVTPPTIDYIKKLDKKYLKLFKVPVDFSKYVKDFSKVNIRTFMNSEEIDKNYKINNDGRYSLLIEAEDEAGNISVERANFIIDSKKPEIVIEGLRKDGTAKKNKSLKIGLYDNKDILKEVVYMGRKVSVSDENCAEIVPSKVGTGILHIEAEDRAGNKLSKDYTITCSAIGGLDGTHISRSMTFIKEKLNNIWLQYNILFKK